jgi:hypothetical protein
VNADGSTLVVDQTETEELARVPVIFAAPATSPARLGLPAAPHDVRVSRHGWTRTAPEFSAIATGLDRHHVSTLFVRAAGMVASGEMREELVDTATL